MDWCGAYILYAHTTVPENSGQNYSSDPKVFYGSNGSPRYGIDCTGSKRIFYKSVFCVQASKVWKISDF